MKAGVTAGACAGGGRAVIGDVGGGAFWAYAGGVGGGGHCWKGGGEGFAGVGAVGDWAGLDVFVYVYCVGELCEVY